MQDRQKNRALYFKELAVTSARYFLPYITGFKAVTARMNVLEIGCGDGGNLLPFSEMGCRTLGVDISEGRIKDAVRFFAERGAEGRFIGADIFATRLDDKFDIILCHDIFEHIERKSEFLSNLGGYLHEDGIIFISFPAWQMPFGGHQQICRSRFISRLPFIHLLPEALYKSILKAGEESEGCIKELLQIKRTRSSIELFEKLAGREKLKIINRELYFINPHYEVKFGLKPRKLNRFVARIPYVRDFLTTSCFYILKPG